MTDRFDPLKRDFTFVTQYPPIRQIRQRNDTWALDIVDRGMWEFYEQQTLKRKLSVRERRVLETYRKQFNN